MHTNYLCDKIKWDHFDHIERREQQSKNSLTEKTKTEKKMHLAVKNLVKKDSPDKNMAGKGIRKKGFVL